MKIELKMNKKSIKIIFLYFLVCLFFTANCSQNSHFKIDKSYVNDLKKSRLDLNLSRTNYLKLCGLYKISRPLISMGFNIDNEIIVSNKNINQKIGCFTSHEKPILFIAEPHLDIRDKTGQKIQKKRLVLDQNGDSERLFYKNYSWRIISRSGELYVRIWNEKNPGIKAFKGFKNYPPSSEFIFEADFKYFNASKSKMVGSKLGVDEKAEFIGIIRFEYSGENFELLVGGKGWTMVGDATNAYTTYGGGRYLYVDLPQKNGKITLDFNYLYNPPCRYSQYTTCLFPPAKNILPFAIEAGELLEFKND